MSRGEVILSLGEPHFILGHYSYWHYNEGPIELRLAFTSTRPANHPHPILTAVDRREIVESVDQGLPGLGTRASISHWSPAQNGPYTELLGLDMPQVNSKLGGSYYYCD